MKQIAALALLLHASVVASLGQELLRTGYAPEAHAPVVFESPDNSGLYQDIFGTAANRIGLVLEIVREPKKRILQRVEAGELDFYPGFSYSDERAAWAYFFRNGLVETDAALTLASEPEILSKDQIDQRGYTVLVPLGGETGKEFKTIYEIPRFSIEKAFEMLALTPRRGDVFVYRKSSFDYFLRLNPGLASRYRIHTKPWAYEFMYLGFSKKSRYARFLPNPLFDPKSPRSERNQPEMLDPSCLAARFMNELLSMERSGEIDDIYLKYYGSKRATPVSGRLP